jgi:phospholipase/carboxylesterase
MPAQCVRPEATALLETVEVTRGADVQASVIWLHGLGADGHDFEPVVPALALPAGLGVRFVFPHAPMRPVTLNNGYVMRAWYDLYDLTAAGRADEAGIRASAAQITALIAREVERGVAVGRIVLAGFSQGGALALHTGLRHPETLAGIMGLSCYLPLERTLAAEAHPANARTPVLLAHGRLDPVLPFAAGERARDALQARGQPVTWHAYTMPHSVCPEEIADISAFLNAVIGRGSSRDQSG